MNPLYDLAHDDYFQRLVKLMEAEAFGSFQSFDPQFQLTWNERQQLSCEGIHMTCDQLRSLKDNTLAVKDSRVWVVHDGQLHIAACHQVQLMRRQHKDALVGTGLAEDFEKNHQCGLPNVCNACLHQLNYLGLDSRRTRRMADRLDELFNMAEFQKRFPFYPV